jgi:trimeric autotransporter adhesin
MSRPAPRWRWLAPLAALGALVTLALSPTAEAAFSSTPAPGLVADGPVSAIAVSGENVYLGGSFNQIGPRTGSGVVFNSTLSELQPGLPAVGGVDAAVDAIVADGEGGWYIGGRFTEVGGVPRTNLAHILADGSVDPNFDPNPESRQANAAVERLVLSGSTLYVAGQFEQIGGQERRYLAALSTATGLATTFAPEPNGEIGCGLVVDGDYVFVCGYFNEVGGQQLTHGLAALNATTGSATAWNPGNESRPDAMYLSPSNVLYLGFYGKFSTDPAHTEYEGLAALQLAAEPDQPPTFLPWHPNIQEVHAITQIGQTLYVGGHFNDVAYAPADRETENYTFYERSNTAAFDVEKNYELLPFEARVEGNEYYVNVSALSGVGGQLYVSGYFYGVGGEPRTDLSAVDPTTGAPMGANPNIDGSVNAIAASGSEVYVGGSIATIDGKPRAHLAVIDAATGALEETDPSVDGTVDALAVEGSTLYVGGSFRNATGAGETEQGRGRLAAFSTTSGALEPFAPEANNTVKALAIAGETLYAGGEFGELEGKAHGDLAAFSTASGKLEESFNPQPNGVVNALTVESERLYAAGSFSEVDATARSDLAAFSTTTGALDQSFLPPSFDRSLMAVAATPSSVYVGGDFSEVGGIYQPRLAALDASDGSLQAWNPEVNDNVDALLLDGSTLYAGGSFQDAGGIARSNLVGLSTATGAATHFAPEPDLEVKALALVPGGLYVGGNFQDLEGIPQPGFAELPSTGSVEEEESKGEQETAERERVERERAERQHGGTGGAEAGSSSEGSDAGSTGLTSTPSTSITGGPPYFTSAHEATFTFTSDAEGASFRCSLDGSTPVACSSPYTVGSLADGVHRFVVQAVSPAGAVDTAGASESFDVTEPLVLAPETTAASTAGVGGPLLSDIKAPATLGTGKGAHKAVLELTLSEPATLTITLRRVEWIPCRHARSLYCLHSLAVGKLAVHARAGANKVNILGDIAKHRLPAGRYTATLRASSSSGRVSKAVTVRFRVLRHR